MLTIWWCPCVESSLVLLEEGVCYDQCVLLAKLYYLWTASFCSPRSNLPVTPDVFRLPTFAFQYPIMKKISFLSAPAATDSAEACPRGATPLPRSRVAAQRSYPTSEIRGGGWECQALMAQEWPRGATPHLGSGWQPGATPRPRPGWQPGCYPTSKVRGCGREEQPHVQGAVAAQMQEGWEELLHIQGQEGQQWGDTPRPR